MTPARQHRLPPGRRQHGLSLLGLLLAAAALMLITLLAIRIVPPVLEYLAVKNAVAAIAASGETVPRAIQQAFDRQAAIDDITSIRGSDLIVERIGPDTVVSFAYEKRIPLFGAVALLVDFNGSTR